ncbi:citrate synthase [Haladaptatus sp. F3-133]|uniref:Citrate synthase n=1 Tax=Halorutilus salinus TaxID=2487751 RepID=A0A9Q4C4E8_9EURY|nr:citrate/2-methylcitrate synthase [Halorutilus salinus]MCX2819657.1 citrate synthase [Halorutilus salinus]
MTDPEPIRRIGLENVVVADTELSHIDGEKPELLYRGVDAQELAEKSSYEETAYLLWNGGFPTRDELDSFRGELDDRRSLSHGVAEIVEHAPEDAVPMDVLRSAVSATSVYGDGDGTTRDRSLSVLAKAPTALAAFGRARDGYEAVEPREDLDTAANFLYMLNGEEPDERHAEILDTALLLHADHGLNASTFTGRVIASTESDVVSAVTGAIGALKGPLHGGANQDVMEMLLDIEDSQKDVSSYLAGMLEDGERVPGFGHRVYEAFDPRAEVFKKIAKEVSEKTDGPDWFSMLEEVEAFLREEKRIHEKGISPNVDLYSGTVYYSLGVPVDFFVPMFAIGRSVGWTAQAQEQYDDNRLVRPRAEYVGERGVEYVPIDERE